MHDLPGGRDSLLVRTCFTAPDAWRRLLRVLDTPSSEGFLPVLGTVDDRAWQDASPQQVLSAAGDARLVVIADEAALGTDGFPLLVLRQQDATTWSVRADAVVMWSVENNLSLGNMDFEEFIAAAGADGVYRGFD